MQSDPNAGPELPTVLVLDDEPFVRHAARRFLKGSGYGCVEAETVDGAIALLRSTPVIAAMLDMRLPEGRTGLDVLNDLRTIPEFREIPVLIVTGSILTETIFSWPGIGKWMVDSVFRRDYPVIQGALLIIAGIIMLVNLGVDLLYGLINPRIRH